MYNKYNWKVINYPSKLDHWKTFQKSYPTIAFNILYIKEKKIRPAYISKIKSNCEKKTILLMIPNKEKKKRLELSCSKETIYIIQRCNMMFGTAFILLEQKINLNLMKKYVKIKISVEL